jgi:hypothetical protein
MDFDALLKQQQEWLDKAAAAHKGENRAAPELVQELRSRQIADKRESVLRLTRQREDTLRRIDAIIAEELAALEHLENELSGRDAPAAGRPRPQDSRRSAKKTKQRHK